MGGGCSSHGLSPLALGLFDSAACLLEFGHFRIVGILWSVGLSCCFSCVAAMC